MILLQSADLGVFESLTQYGALGIMVLGMGLFIWFLLKKLFASEAEYKQKYEDSQKELNTYLKEDRNSLLDEIKSINELKEIIIKKLK